MPPEALSHTFRRNGLFYLRIAVPAPLQQLVGKTEFRYSLATGLRSEARLRADFVSSRIKAMFQSLRSKSTAMQALTQENLADALAAYIRMCIANFHVLHAKYKQRMATLGDRDNQGNDAFIKLVDETSALFATYNENKISNILSKIDYSTDESSVEKFMFVNASGPIDKELQFLSDFMLNGDAYNASIILERIQSYCNSLIFNHKNNRTFGMRATGMLTNHAVQHSLREVVDKYIEENKSNWTSRTTDEFSSILDTFVAICGDIDTNSITKLDIKNYKDTLQLLPQGWKRINEFKTQSIQQLLSKKHTNTTTKKTVNKHLSLVSSLLRWGTKNGYCKDNHATGMQIRMKPVDPKDIRSPWSAEELEILFSKEKYPMNGPAHMFWLPVLGLLTGARIDELCQLRCCDIRSVEGIWCIDINDNSNKRIKTAFSKRLIPLHLILVNELQFINFVEHCRSNHEELLFPELFNSKAHAGKLASSHFSHFKKRVLKIDNEKISFHSLRHTTKKMADLLKTDKRWMNDLFGWQNEGTGDVNYGEKTPPSILYKNIIEQLEITVDLSCLKESPYVSGNFNKTKSPKKRMSWKQSAQSK